jgi:hypothetical protein
MGVVVGPVLARPGGYAFDTWTVEDGLSRGYLYSSAEDAHHAAIELAVGECELIDSSDPFDGVCICDTLEEFTLELAERGVLVTAVRELCSLHVA